MKRYTLLALATLALPLALGGCLVRDDDYDPDYVPAPSTTVIERDRNPDIHVNPAPNVTIQRDSPPVIIHDKSPDINVDVKTPPIEIKKTPPTQTTTGF
jgi:hypothetical protein